MEAPANVTEYIQYVEQMYSTKQGIVLARSLSLNGRHVVDACTWADDGGVYQAKNCVPPIDELIVYHLICLKALHMHNYIEAYNYQRSVVIVVIQMMEQEIGTNWMLPLMYTACLDLRLVAQKADATSDNPGTILENAASCLIACFQICAADDNPSEENSKRVGLLTPINHLLRIYFRLDKYNLCQPMIRAVQLSVAGGTFSVAQQIIFKFYVGRLAVLEGDYRKAEKYLLFAFKKCYAGSYRNKQLILTYLLPVKLLLGFMPTKPLVEKYDLLILWDLATAIKAGDIKQFELIVEVNSAYFGNSGLFCTLQNLRMIAIRNVFKKVYRSHNSHRIPIACFQIGLQIMSGENIDTSQILSLIANMINTQKIRAYMSYQQQEVIFCANTAFPCLSSIKFTTP